MAGFIAENILEGRVKVVHWQDMKNISADAVIIDVRTKEEFEFGHIYRAVNIPLDELRYRLSEVPADKPVYAYCAVGLRGYTASRILLQHAYTAVYNLSGGYKTYSCILHDQRDSIDNECDEKQAYRQFGGTHAASHRRRGGTDCLFHVDGCDGHRKRRACGWCDHRRGGHLSGTGRTVEYQSVHLK